MAALQNSMPSLHHTLFVNPFPQKGLQKLSHGAFLCCKTSVSLHVRAEHLSSSAAASSTSSHFQESCGRRQIIAAGIIAPLVSIADRTPTAFAAETKKGFLPVTDKKDGYTFLYPFGWQHDVDGKAYYTFEFITQPPNFTRHALTAVSIGNGKFYTLTTGANERRWDKMKDRLVTVVDFFKIFNV
ncbi:PsbP-like protein 1 isoform 2 [Hibiscus syriacus]|uniref:PsbP-like protein 1 isoform 2 n=1 Tax=Hibiscus syriacus TaxID=106335 RepID=A0A6A2XA62_HIBSY|nr:PsbP-like protein 1 isoform 2 [Hibiscus syriacus]